MSINHVAISGNLTRDAELRQAGSTSVLAFGVAVNDRRKNPSTGEWEDVPNFVDCIMFGNRAVSLAQYMTKGTKTAIEGRLRYSSWEKDGQKRSKLEVIVDELEFMSRANQQAQQPAYTAPAPAYAAQQPTGYTPAPQPQQAAQFAANLYDEDVPF